MAGTSHWPGRPFIASGRARTCRTIGPLEFLPEHPDQVPDAQPGMASSTNASRRTERREATSPGCCGVGPVWNARPCDERRHLFVRVNHRSSCLQTSDRNRPCNAGNIAERKQVKRRERRECQPRTVPKSRSRSRSNRLANCLLSWRVPAGPEGRTLRSSANAGRVRRHRARFHVSGRDVRKPRLIWVQSDPAWGPCADAPFRALLGGIGVARKQPCNRPKPEIGTRYPRQVRVFTEAQSLYTGDGATKCGPGGA